MKETVQERLMKEALSEKTEKIMRLLERHGAVCGEGTLTVALEKRKRNELELKPVGDSYRLSLPITGSDVPGQLEEQLAYGITAYVIRNFNPDTRTALKTVEEILCRVVSVRLLRSMGFREKAAEVLAGKGTPFVCETEEHYWEKPGDTEEDIRTVSRLFTWKDLLPFLRIRDYVEPFDVGNRELNTKALLADEPDSRAVQALCGIWRRIESDTDDFVDYMMGDPYPD